MRLFRLIIYVENKGNLTYIASKKKKKKRDTRTFSKNNRRYCFMRLQIIRTHKHRKKQCKVSFNLPTLTIPSGPGPGPEALDFSRRLPWGRMVEYKKEQGFRVLVIWVNHLIANSVCGTSIL